MLEKNQQNSKIKQRVIVFLNREQVDFLDRLGKDSLFSGGKKLSRTKIMSSLVDLLIGLCISGQDIYSTDDLKQKIKEKIGAIWPTTKELLNLQIKEDRQEGA